MAKVLLVEDDNNLREIYQARLTAEGYDIVAAQNGEEALVLAKQHHPDLIISDVMMPRISGYEMLDILRNTEELKDTKVIMLTALGQSEDKDRAGKLGADKYLVKSQVTLEDIVNSAKALLADTGSATAAAATTPDPSDPLGMATPDPVASSDSSASVSPVASTVLPPSDTQVAVDPVAVTSVPDPLATLPIAPPEMPAEVHSAPASIAPQAPATPAVEEAPAPAATENDTALQDALTSLTQQVEQTTTEPAESVESTTSAPAAETPFTAPVEPTEPIVPDAQAVEHTPVQSIKAEQAAVDQQIASFTEAPAEEPSHQIEGLSGVTEVVEVPSEQPATMPVDPMPAAQSVEQPAPESAPSVTPVDSPQPEPMVAPADTGFTQTVTPTETAAPAATPEPAVNAPEDDGVAVVGKKVIQPLNDPNAKPDLNRLLAEEEAKTGLEAPAPTTNVQPVAPSQTSTPASAPTSPVASPPVTPPPSNDPNDPNNIAL